MPREMTLNDPLCGAEIKSIAVQKFADALDRDCTLVDDLTYAGFTLKFEATIGFLRSNTAPTLVWGNVAQGEQQSDNQQRDLVKDEYAASAPNVAREENNLPIPVMVQTPSGPKRQKVRFQKPEAYKKGGK
jgi:hypothetical protein